MQNIWSRVAPARSSCRCFSCWNSASEGVTARGTTAASKRRLRIANSVTALYSSVFFAATVADARAKDKRRAEWEEKIAAVNKQVSDLEDEEKRLLEALLRRRRPVIDYARRRMSPGLFPVRHYSTAPNLAYKKGYSLQSERPSDCNVFKEEDNKYLMNFSRTFEDAQDENGDVSDAYSFPPWVTGDELRVQAIQKLAVKQLAIRFLLRPSVSHTYEGNRMTYQGDNSLPRLNLNDLFLELNSVRHRIGRLKGSDDTPFDDLVEDLPLSRRQAAERRCEELDAEVAEDIGLCARHEMSLEELLLRLSNNLIQSPIPDRPKAFRLMITAFTEMRQNDLVYLILKTLLYHRFLIDTPLIIAIISFYSRVKDLSQFDFFLDTLRGEGCAVNLGRSAYYILRNVNGVQVTTPPIDNYLAVYERLITAALRFDQPHRADAWLQIVRRTGFMDNFNLLFAYMNFYAMRKDWQKGSETMRRALAFMASPDNHIGPKVERLIILMVHLCDSCRRFSVSHELIRAFVLSGFDVNAAIKQNGALFKRDSFRRRWKIADYQDHASQKRSLSEKCHTFLDIIYKRLGEPAMVGNNGYEPANDGFAPARKGPLRQRQAAAQLFQHSQNALTSTILGTFQHVNPNKFYAGHVEREGDLKNHSKQIKAMQNEIAELKSIVSQITQANDS
ncbi:hypothetical protein PHISCL_06978 [Aspergillus sclerotialis]|uniref:Uncharacterized protein n=1 Tax=Aspergillus sclerotialis TaxID=2070753 RepID=A0A3A2ZBY5_9EURO|nr:hypothetical protein PHISCL_06978 [Aspergillus sclerotialis]